MPGCLPFNTGRTAATAQAIRSSHPLPRCLQAIEYLLNRNFLLTALELVQEAGEAGLAHEVESLMCVPRVGVPLCVGWQAGGTGRDETECPRLALVNALFSFPASHLLKNILMLQPVLQEPSLVSTRGSGSMQPREW